MLEAGHDVTLYTYYGVENVPKGITIEDGREILPVDHLLKHEKHDSYALGSDIFRYTILKKGLGIWLDTDILCLCPIELKQDYLFGWEDNNKINGAVLFLPRDSGVLNDLLQYCYSRPLIPPWWATSKKARQFIKGLVGKDCPPEKMEWGGLGPRALTYFAMQHDLLYAAQPRNVFYPVHYSQADILFNPKEDVNLHLSEETMTIHLWNELIKKNKAQHPPDGSYLDQVCHKYKIFALD